MNLHSQLSSLLRLHFTEYLALLLWPWCQPLNHAFPHQSSFLCSSSYRTHVVWISLGHLQPFHFSDPSPGSSALLREYSQTGSMTKRSSVVSSGLLSYIHGFFFFLIISDQLIYAFFLFPALIAGTSSQSPVPLSFFSAPYPAFSLPKWKQGCFLLSSLPSQSWCSSSLCLSSRLPWNYPRPFLRLQSSVCLLQNHKKVSLLLSCVFNLLVSLLSFYFLLLLLP